MGQEAKANTSVCLKIRKNYNVPPSEPPHTGLYRVTVPGVVTDNEPVSPLVLMMALFNIGILTTLADEKAQSFS
jgi:hypothetical protein